jgi:hypothetical protein
MPNGCTWKDGLVCRPHTSTGHRSGSSSVVSQILDLAPVDPLVHAVRHRHERRQCRHRVVSVH